MDHKDRGVGEKRVKCRRLSGVLGPCTKHCDEGGVGLKSSRDTLDGREVCEPPRGRAGPQSGREMSENIASLPRFFGMLVFSLHTVQYNKLDPFHPLKVTNSFKISL